MSKKIILPEQLRDHGIKIGDRQRRRLEAAGLFPRRVPLSSRSHGYVEEEITSYLEHAVAMRDAIPRG